MHRWSCWSFSYSFSLNWLIGPIQSLRFHVRLLSVCVCAPSDAVFQDLLLLASNSGIVCFGPLHSPLSLCPPPPPPKKLLKKKIKESQGLFVIGTNIWISWVIQGLLYLGFFLKGPVCATHTGFRILEILCWNNISRNIFSYSSIASNSAY